MKKFFLSLSLLVPLLFASTDALCASARGGGFSGGGRSSFSGGSSRGSSWSGGGGSRSSSWSSGTKSSGSWSSPSSGTKSSGSWFSGSSKSSSPSSGTTSSGWGSWGSSSKSASGTNRSSSWGTPRPQQSVADRALADKAKASGTAYQSRADATSAFQKQYATTYTSRYSVEPSARPIHIPPTYVYGGSSYNIVYNRQYGGYGYYYNNSWVYYDAFCDGVMMSNLMTRHNYYYPSQTVYYDNSNGGGSSFGYIIICICVGLVLLVIIGVIVSRE